VNKAKEITMEKFGIENIKKLLDVGLEIGNVAGMWKETGSGGYVHLIKLADEVMALPSVDWKLLDDEFKDLSEEEMKALYSYAEAKFDIPQDLIEVIVEKALFMSIKVLDLVKDGFELAKIIKPV
jgi:hypothetical protein